MGSVLYREAIYLWDFFLIQLEQIFMYWVVGMLIGSVVSVFFKDRIHGAFRSLSGRRPGAIGIVISSLLGVASPLCMYGTIPIAASFSESGVRDEWLAAFMMSSVLLNPQLLFYSVALGIQVMLVRLISCILCGVGAGILVRIFYRNRSFFRFEGMKEPQSRDTHPNLFVRFLKNLGRNIRATGPYFLIGIALSAVFQRYVPQEAMTFLFGGNRFWGVLMAATIGVPLYACGGGTIPLLQAWIGDGMSVGSAAAFMLTGPATKITNLGALKIVLGMKRFLLYIAYVICFALLTGLVVNLIFL